MMPSERRTVAPSSEFIVIWRERFSKGGGSLRSPILGGKGRRPPTTVGWQKTKRIALSCGITYLSPVGSLD